MTFVHLLCVNVICVTLSCVDMLVCVCVCTCGHWDDNVLLTVSVCAYVPVRARVYIQYVFITTC